ncbi:MAG: gamma carbonic anhydrase family protein [Treponema sp.]|jgi:carbonic anhydrase/acetyltransferase-like protein (isoleucine patch superfamily)|nr:gamma carbonic anhydrase family protein [Treponema sp.]
MIHAICNRAPDTKNAAFIAWSAEISGDVILGKDVTVWFSSVLRGDIAPITVGNRSNIQDGAVIHGDMNVPTVIGDNVTVGHGAILHSCIIENNCLIGMGAIILGKSRIGEKSIVAAGSLIPQNKEFPPCSLIMGSPAKVVRTLSPEEIHSILENSEEYVKLGLQARTEYKNCETANCDGEHVKQAE